MKLINLYQTEAKEINEYELSIVIHIILLVALSISTAVKSIPKPLPKVVPVTLIAQVEKPKAAAVAPAKPQSGSKKAAGTTPKVAKPKQAAPVKATKAKSSAKPVKKAKAVPTKQPTKAKTQAIAKTTPKKEVTTNKVVAETAVVPIAAVTPAQTNLPSVISNPIDTNTPSKPVLNSPTFDDVTDITSGIGNPTNMLEDISGPTMISDSDMLIPESSMDDDKLFEAPSDTPSPVTGTADGNNGTGVFEVGSIEAFGGNNNNFVAPSIISRVQPEYPDWARKEGVHGNAVYRVLIQPSGTVGDVVTMSSTIDPKLAINGAQALRRWVFTPVLNNGVPQETWVKISVQYELN